jgi:hypothetical protein
MSPSLSAQLVALRELRRWLSRHLPEARTIEPAAQRDFYAVIVAGRRNHLTPTDASLLRELNEEEPRISIRTYDWLIDSVAKEAE